MADIETAPAPAISDDKRAWISAMLGIELGSGDAAPVRGKPPANSAPGGAAPGGAAGPAAVAIPDTMSPTGMKDEDIAAAIMDKQIAIIVGWKTALLVFDKTMTSSADAEATPDFQKTVVGYFSGKLMGALINHTPGASELDAMVSALSAEYTRAATAGASATLRDFVIQHAQAIGRLEQATLAGRQGFISAVRARREAIEAPSAPVKPTKGGKAPKWGMVEPSKADDDYAAMRIVLLDTLDSVTRVLSVSTSESLFRTLSEEWVRHATVAGGMGTRFQAVVVIRLNANYTILDAHIQGAGGQKLAEQLLKDSPDGVDVFRLQAPRRILLMAENGWPSAILSLDANNRDTSTGSIAEGNTDALKKYVMSKGLPVTKKLAGD